MRKMFRFKYEPCKGDCYAWCDSLPEELNKLLKDERIYVVAKMVEAHDKLCDNPEYSFGIDRDDNSGMFVAHFRTPQSTDTFLNNNFYESVMAVTSMVLSSEIPKVNGQCSYGNNGAEDLGQEILRACEDIVYREEHHKNCPCTKKVV